MIGPTAFFIFVGISSPAHVSSSSGHACHTTGVLLEASRSIDSQLHVIGLLFAIACGKHDMERVFLQPPQLCRAFVTGP